MAASSKPTGVHAALVIFVLIAIACGVGWVMSYKGAGSISELRKERDDAVSKQKTTETKLREREEDLKRIKDLSGILFEDVGADASNENTVLGAMKKLMTDYGGGVVDPTLKNTMVKLNQEMRNAAMSRDKLQEQLAVQIAQYEQKLAEVNKALDVEKKARTESDKGKTDADKIHQEELTKREALITDLRKEASDLQAQLDELNDSTTKKINELDKRVASLIVINKTISAELDEKTRVSFEKPNGQIRYVDTIGKLVWINLGDVDGIRPKTTFSVYKKQHSGVGRGTVKGAVGGEDIKGAIEVTRVIDDHLAEARILNEDIFSPIMKGDPIYSPLWSSAHDEAFAFVGIVDLNGDKKDDRDELYEFVKTSGATIEVDIDGNGVLKINGKLAEGDEKPIVTEKTKFVVIGYIPDLAETADADAKQNIQKIHKYRKELEDAARERGVRIVKMSDFLNYVGYKVQRRLYIPGSEIPYNLKAGAASKGVNESSGSKRQGSGSTSGAYSGDKAIKPRSTSSGDGTNKVFRGGK